VIRGRTPPAARRTGHEFVQEPIAGISIDGSLGKRCGRRPLITRERARREGDGGERLSEAIKHRCRRLVRLPVGVLDGKPLVALAHPADMADARERQVWGRNELAVACKLREGLLARSLGSFRIHVVDDGDARVGELDRGDVDDVPDERDQLALAGERVERAAGRVAGMKRGRDSRNDFRGARKRGDLAGVYFGLERLYRLVEVLAIVTRLGGVRRVQEEVDIGLPDMDRRVRERDSPPCTRPPL
jgi:hypothetical protein